MTQQRTAHVATPISVQQPAFDVLNSLAAQYPALPAAYVTLHTPFAGRLGSMDLQLQTASEFELWRDALDIPTEDVSFHASGAYIWVEAVTKVLDVRLSITGGVSMTYASFYAPRDREDVAA